MTFRALALAGAAVCAMTLAVQPARADVIQLGFILDGSGSIGSSNWNIIRQGLADAVATYTQITRDGGTVNGYRPALPAAHCSTRASGGRSPRRSPPAPGSSRGAARGRRSPARTAGASASPPTS